MINVNNLSSEDAGYILELAPILDIASAERLAKGHEQKFLIKTTQGEKRLLRIGDIKHYEWAKADVHMYNYVAAAGINVSQSISIGVFQEGNLTYHLFTWIEGEDLIEVLPRMNPADQFSAGIKSGELMRKLHTLPPENEAEPWKVRFGRKVQKLIQSYSDKLGKSQGVDLLVQYLQDNLEWVAKRPQTFTHGDWNTENLIYTPDGQIGIIDLSGENDYGDPWWEFWLTPHDLNSSPHFYTGQIKGYFEGEPPLEFFQLLAYYTVFSTLEFLDDFTEECAPENVKRVLNWFDEMRNPVPNWYLMSDTVLMNEKILQYEKDFFSFKFCSNRANLENRLAKDFFEYGKSGMIHTRENTINSLASLTEDRRIEIINFELTVLSEDVLLVHYTSWHKDDDLYTLRTSIWRYEDGEWKLYFHQGTPLNN